MKQIICALFLAFPMPLSAQPNQGTITYEEIVQIDVENIPELAEFAAMLPKEARSTRALYYSGNTSLYKSIDEPKKTVSPTDNGSVKVSVNTDENRETIYTNLATNTTVEQKEFMGRKFNIEGSIKPSAWKLGTKTKTIAGYPCQDAFMIQDKDTIVAWFTPQIPVPTGPRGLGGLPGVIMEVKWGNTVQIVAKDVSQKLDNKMVAKPRGGKKLTAAAFEQLVAEKTAETQSLEGSNGERIIIRREMH